MFKKLTLIFSILFSINSLAIEAKIERIKGDVLVNGRKARVGQKLKERMIVEAQGKKSFAQVNFSNGDIIRVRDGSMVIQKLDGKVSKFKVLRGLFFAHAEKKQKRKLQVQTPHASMGIRGTKFFITESEEETYLCVCDGSVELSNESGDILVTRGEDLHANKTNKLKTEEASSVMWKMATTEFKDMGLEVAPR